MAKSEKPNAFSLQGKLPRITQLNRTAILLIGGVILVALLLILFSVFSGSGNKDDQNAQPATLKAGTTNNQDKPTQLSGLPTSYGDAQSINKILNRDQPQQAGQQPSAAVLAQLASLQAQQAQLQSQLAAVRSQQAQPPVQQPVQNYQAPPSPLDQEAMTSAIFFSGGAPLPPPQPTAKTAEEAKKAAATANGNSTANQTDYEKQNMQAQKLDFLNSKPSTAIYNKNHIQYPGSKYILQAGTTIPAILKTKLESTNPGYIVAIVTQNVYDSLDGQYLIIPKGSTLMGEYSSQVAFGQSSLQAKFTRLIRPDGTSIVLPNEVGGDTEGVSGLTDQVNNHWGSVIGSAVLAAVFNIPSIVATNQMQNSNSGCYIDSTTGNQVCNSNTNSTLTASAMQSLGATATQVGGQITQRSLNLQPTITIRAGYQFSVMVTKDIILPPYQMPLNESIPETSAE